MAYNGPASFLPPSQGPGWLAALLQRPGLSDALMATGAALLAQKDQPGSLGGALGRALPMGMQAFQQGQEEARINELMASAPPEMQQLLRALPAGQRGAALFSLLMPKAPEEYTLGPGDKRFRGATEIASVAPEVETPQPTAAEREFAFYQTLSPDQKKAFDEWKAAGNRPMVQVNTGEKEGFDRTNTLADDFFAQTTEARAVADAVRRAQGAGDSAVGDQTKIVVLNNLLDPAAQVRPDDIERVGGAGGLNERAQRYFNQIRNGRLPTKVAQEIDAEILSLARAARDSFAPVVERFNERATSFGVDPKRVTQDWFAGINLEGGNPYLNTPKVR